MSHVYEYSTRTVYGPLVPLVLEEGGRFGDHALLGVALLSEIAEFGAQTGKLKVPESRASLSPNAVSSAYWVRKWKQEVSGWLQVTMSDTLLHSPSDTTYLVPLCMGPKVTQDPRSLRVP